MMSQISLRRMKSRGTNFSPKEKMDGTHLASIKQEHCSSFRRRSKSLKWMCPPSSNIACIALVKYWTIFVWSNFILKGWQINQLCPKSIICKEWVWESGEVLFFWWWCKFHRCQISLDSLMVEDSNSIDWQMDLYSWFILRLLWNDSACGRAWATLFAFAIVCPW